MNKQMIEINVPEGYEVAAGDQPRAPKKGDLFMDGNLEARSCFVDFEATKYIILKKKKQGRYKRYRNFNDELMVSAQAVTDALEVAALDDWGEEDQAIYNELRELVK